MQLLLFKIEKIYTNSDFQSPSRIQYNYCLPSGSRSVSQPVSGRSVPKKSTLEGARSRFVGWSLSLSLSPPPTSPFDFRSSKELAGRDRRLVRLIVYREKYNCFNLLYGNLVIHVLMNLKKYDDHITQIHIICLQY